MYWPIGTPRVYATSTSAKPALQLSHDGLDPTDDDAALRGAHPDNDENPPTPLTNAPRTPKTPAINSVENSDDLATDTPQQSGPEALQLPSGNPILALQLSRSGHLFAVITESSLAVWQTKPTVIQAVVVRSSSSLSAYGPNVALLMRPDSAVIVVRTALGFLITYSFAADSDSRVYKPHFSDHTNIQRRRQSHFGGPGNTAPDQILLGPGEGVGVRDASLRFRRVIKVDAGIEAAIALDDELIVSTRKPAAVQCIRWSPDSTGSQTTTELVSRMAWVENEKKVLVTDITHDRPMNLSTWITSDGRVYAVQRTGQGRSSQADADADPKKLFKGYCFHNPQGEHDRAVKAAVNARFSLVAVATADGNICVYSARDYAGNIPRSHVHANPVTSRSSGAPTTLAYSPDGYCLFVGYEKGWSTWSVFGKTGGQGFHPDPTMTVANKEHWLEGITEASWIGGACEILLVGRESDSIWMLEMARSAVTGCYSPPNLFRTVLQSSTNVMVYRGYDTPDLTSISAEPFLWHTARIPSSYLIDQWPIKCTVVSPDGRYVAVAGRRGLAHYSINSGRWKTFANKTAENEFQVRGGMCWHQHILIAAIEANRSYELRLYSRESALDTGTVSFTHEMPAPIVLITPSGEDSLLVYTYDNLLYHFILAPVAGTVRPIQVGQIAFHGIVRSPARVRGLSWLLPEDQLLNGDPAQDVTCASVLFLVDGKLVLLQPSLNADGQLKYDMRVISHNMEFYISMRDQSAVQMLGESGSRLSVGAEEGSLRNSLWVFEGHEVKLWPDVHDVLKAASAEPARDLPAAVSIPVDFYPLSVLLSKGIVLGVEPDMVQRRDVNFSFFRFSIRVRLSRCSIVN